MKKVLIFILTLVMLISLSGCENNTEDNDLSE